MLPLHHALMLLLTDSARGTGQVDRTMLDVALAGAMVGELQMRGRLVPMAANRFTLASGVPCDGALGIAEQRLAGFEGTLKDAIPKVNGWWGRGIWEATMEELVARGAVSRVQDRLLGVTWRTRWPSADGDAAAAVKARLRAWVELDPAGPPAREDLLLSLARGTSTLARIWPDPAELSARRPVIDACTDRAPLGRLVKTLYDELAAGGSV